MASGKRAVLLDIEGTTTPISFVSDILFPYARDNLEPFLKAHWQEAECQDCVTLIREQASLDLQSTTFASGIVEIPKTKDDAVPAVIQNVTVAMNENRKITSLKQLQGYMWRFGYESGKLKGVVYPDVTQALQRWKGHQPVYIYSSGSVEAQKLLFKHSDQGDLLPFINGYFDTNIGSKLDPTSYTKIAAEIKHSPEEILFLTDNINEVRAALKAGLLALLVYRPGNAPIGNTESVTPMIKSFDQVEDYL